MHLRFLHHPCNFALTFHHGIDSALAILCCENEVLTVTTVFTLPKPVSKAAVKLRRVMEADVPVSVTLDCSARLLERRFVVNKYLGQAANYGSPLVDMRRGTGLFAVALAGIRENDTASVPAEPAAVSQH